MTFQWPALLLLTPLLITALLLAWRLSDRRRRRNSGLFADDHLFSSVVRSDVPSRVRLLRGLQLLALAALLVAAARPEASPPLPTNQAAVVIALDASRSMLAGDVDPNRLEVARGLAKEFIEGAPPTAKVGVASFSDSAFVLLPPTTARDEVLAALDRIEAAANTSLAAAIVAGVRMLPGREQAQPPLPLERDDPGPAAVDAAAAPGPLPPGRILVISDGVTNVSGTPGLPPDQELDLSLTFAEQQEVEVFTVPVGQEGGTVAQIEGHNYFVPFDGDTLARISERTGGQQLDAGEPERLRAAFRDLGREIRWEASEMEISSLISGAAVMLLLVAGGLGLASSRRLP